MTITRLSPDRRIPGCVIVDVDGGRFASLPIELVRALGLKAGVQLNDAQAARLRDVAAAEAAHRVATRLLAVHPRTEHELGRKLRERGHPEAAIRSALDRLRVTRALDDEAVSRRFAAGRLLKGHGPSRVLSDLLARGVERQGAERAIQEASQEEGVETDAQVRRLLERRVRSVAGLAPEVQRRRLLAFLARRGFRGREIQALVSRSLADLG